MRKSAEVRSEREMNGVASRSLLAVADSLTPESTCRSLKGHGARSKVILKAQNTEPGARAGMPANAETLCEL